METDTLTGKAIKMWLKLNNVANKFNIVFEVDDLIARPGFNISAHINDAFVIISNNIEDDDMLQNILQCYINFIEGIDRSNLIPQKTSRIHRIW